MAEIKLGIFPASGKLGGSTLKHLADSVKPTQVVAIVRKPHTVPVELVNKGIIVRTGDFDDAASLDHAFDGISILNLISYPSFVHDHRVKVHRLAIDAARKSGVSHIFYSSLAFAFEDKPTSLALVMQAHLDTESYLAQIARQDPSFTYTIARIGIYSESFPIYTAFFNVRNPVDTIKIPHDGSGPGIAFAKRDELGHAVALLIKDYSEGNRENINKILLLSGPRAYSLDETVDILARVSKKQVRIQKVSVDEYAAQSQVHEGFGADLGAQWADSWDAIRQGETAVVSTLLAQVLGREPESFQKTVESLASSDV